MAEVAAMEGPANARGRRGGQQVVVDAAAVDESGELVLQRFLQFLGE
jgi:hypothetical protein